MKWKVFSKLAIVVAGLALATRASAHKYTLLGRLRAG